MENAKRAALLQRYRDGYGALSLALSGLDEGELDARRTADEWTIREIIHHLADAEMITAIRFRRLIAEDAPTIEGYDEGEYARRLHYADRPIESSLEAIRAARATTADILDRLSEDEWKRRGTHVERGKYSPDISLGFCAGHLHDHAEQVRRIRRAQ
jgi:hypothetical protein